MNLWGPQNTIPSHLLQIPYAPFSKTDRLGRIADWTTPSQEPERETSKFRSRRHVESLFTYQHEKQDDADFEVVDRVKSQQKLTRSTGISNYLTTGSTQQPRNTRSQSWTMINSAKNAQSVKSSNASLNQNRRARIDKQNRTTSIKISDNWKLLDELDFTRMSKLHLESDDPIDVYVYLEPIRKATAIFFEVMTFTSLHSDANNGVTCSCIHTV